MKTETVTLENLGRGAAAEMFQAELEKLAMNIMDPNTKADALRAITLKLKVRPAGDRMSCTVEISCDSKLAPAAPLETMLFVGQEQGRAVVTEYNPDQMQIFPEVEPTKVKLELINPKSSKRRQSC